MFQALYTNYLILTTRQELLLVAFTYEETKD